MDFNIITLEVGGFDRNLSYLAIAGNGDCALVDPTGDAQLIRQAVESHPEIRPRYILLTHGHLDHTQALGESLSFFPAPVVAHPNHPEAGSQRISNGKQLPFGDSFIETIFTPGHSRDSVCYKLNESALFTGDVLFVGCIGFCRSRDMYQSLYGKIMKLNDEIVIYPGHDYGEVPHRSLGAEKRHNPFLQCASLEEFKAKLKELI